MSGGSFTAGSEEARAGIEPANSGFADRCLTTWLPRHGEEATNPPEGEQGSPARSTLGALRAALDHVTDAILTADADGHLLTGNAAARTLLALSLDSPLEGHALDDTIAPEAHAIFAAAREHARTLGAWTGDLVLRRANSEDCPVALTLLAQRATDGRLIGWSVVARELASPLRERAADSQARRYEAVGRLASGVAHDFQNLLAATLATAEHLLQRAAAGSAERADVDAIRTSTERSAALVKQLLGFARRAFDAERASDLNAAIRHVESLLARVVTPAITIEFDLAPRLPLILIERSALEQGLLTLAVVIRDALPVGGVMRIRTDEMVHTSADARRSVAPPGRYVTLTVSARGPGAAAPAGQRRRDDTGLSLASITALAMQAGGYVWADTLPGREATYSIWIPRADDELSATPLG